jgi:hypothetical protein
MEVDGEQIVIDESLMDFSDFSPKETLLVGTLGIPLLVDDEATVGGVAVMLAVKLARGRDWDQDTIAEVILLLTAWLSDNLEPVDG